jgi:NAD(P)H-dependent FMN reductase
MKIGIILGSTRKVSKSTVISEWILDKSKNEEAQFEIIDLVEYNHSISGALKNALDSAKSSWANKAAGIVSYGGSGGARAAEHLRGILAELQVATVRSHVLISTYDDFNDGIFKPRESHNIKIDNLFKQTISWSKALKTVR